MIPYADRLNLLKESVITYLTDKLNEDKYQTTYPIHIHSMKSSLKDLPVEELCKMADRIYFQSLKI